MNRQFTEEEIVVHDIEAEIAKHPLEVQHTIKNMAEAITEFTRNHPGLGHMAVALVGARMAAGQV